MVKSVERERILGWLDTQNSRQLAGASRSSVADSLRYLLEAAEAGYPRIDEDRLARSARIMRGAGHDGLDVVVGEWLASKPSPARTDIASVVLETFWNPALGRPTPDQTVVTDLLTARTSPGVTMEGEASAARALCMAYEAGLPHSVGVLVLDVLTDALRRPNTNPALHPWILRTLRRAGRVAQSVQ